MTRANKADHFPEFGRRNAPPGHYKEKARYYGTCYPHTHFSACTQSRLMQATSNTDIAMDSRYTQRR